MKLILLKKGGQAGNVAINPALVTDVRSSTGAFTDVHFNNHFVSVQGSFDQVVALLSGQAEEADEKPSDWYNASRAR